MKSLANSSAGLVRRATDPAAWGLATTAVRAWRAIPARSWIAVAAIGFVYFLFSLVTILPQIVGVFATFGGSKRWDAQSFIGLALMCVAGAYCFLVVRKNSIVDSGLSTTLEVMA